MHLKFMVGSLIPICEYINKLHTRSMNAKEPSSQVDAGLFLMSFAFAYLYLRFIVKYWPIHAIL